MMNISANYRVLPLAGTMTENELGDGITASSVHRVYCLAAGDVTITAKGGGTFTFTAASANEYIDVVVKSLTVNTGTFIGFKTKDESYQWRPQFGPPK
jgi:hypothetical protein